MEPVSRCSRGPAIDRECVKTLRAKRLAKHRRVRSLQDELFWPRQGVKDPRNCAADEFSHALDPQRTLGISMRATALQRRPLGVELRCPTRNFSPSTRSPAQGRRCPSSWLVKLGTGRYDQTTCNPRDAVRTPKRISVREASTGSPRPKEYDPVSQCSAWRCF